jgi:hypothetical protein
MNNYNDQANGGKNMNLETRWAHCNFKQSWLEGWIQNNWNQMEKEFCDFHECLIFLTYEKQPYL